MLSELAKKTAIQQTTTRNTASARSWRRKHLQLTFHRPRQIRKPKRKKNAKKKDRRAYYREYNKKHPERLDRGFIKGYVNGNVSDGAINNTVEIYGIRIIGHDELGLPITNNPFGDMLRNKEMEWHDDDWCEGPD